MKAELKIATLAIVSILFGSALFLTVETHWARWAVSLTGAIGLILIALWRMR